MNKIKLFDYLSVGLKRILIVVVGVSLVAGFLYGIDHVEPTLIAGILFSIVFATVVILSVIVLLWIYDGFKKKG